MLHKTVIVLAITAALIGGLTADALARGGGFGGGAHMGGAEVVAALRANPAALLGPSAPQMPAFENRSPGPTRVARAGTRRQWAHVTARVPGDDRNWGMMTTSSRRDFLHIARAGAALAAGSVPWRVSAI